MRRILSGLVLLSWAVAASIQAEEARPWNFLVILLDDAGWNDLGFTGNDFIETPHMDRLAARGMTFLNAYATHPFCSPTRQSMITGQWPARTAWMRKEDAKDRSGPREEKPYCPAVAFTWNRQRPQFVSLAEALKSRGYRTGHVGKWHFGLPGMDISPESEGFDFNFGGAADVGAVKNFFAPFEGLPGHVPSQPGEYLTDRLTQEALRFIRDHKDAPFFLQLWHYAPHMPVMAPEALVAKYREKRRRLGRADLNPTYAAMVERIDTGVGRILDELRRLGLEDRTVVFLTSDNGGLARFGSIPVAQVAPLRGEKGWIYEGGIREPMAVVWPGHTPPGAKSDLPVSVLDFYPTILDIAGVSYPAGQPVDGLSLVPLLERGRQPERDDRAHYWYNVTVAAQEDGAMLQPVAAVRRGPWKLIRFFADRTELYNLPADPAETDNRLAKEPEVAAALEKLLDAWLRDTGVALPVANARHKPDYIVPRQIAVTAIPAAARPLREWTLRSAHNPWKAARMIRTEVKEDALRMHAEGPYPEICARDVEGMHAGVYVVEIKLRVATSGRIRFAWKEAKNLGGVVEFFPERDGQWHTLAGVFETRGPVSELRLAAPTHLKETGHYDAATQPDYIEVESIRVRTLPPQAINAVKAAMQSGVGGSR